MKPGDLSSEWGARLREHGPREAARVVGEALLSAGSTAWPQIRALEILLVTLPPEQSAALVETIREDARALRRSSGGAADRVRVVALGRRKQELEERIAELTQAAPADPALQRRIEALANDERRLRESISQLTNERDRMTLLLQRVREAKPCMEKSVSG